MVAKAEVSQLVRQAPVLSEPVASGRQHDHAAARDAERPSSRDLGQPHDIDAEPVFKAFHERTNEPFAENLPHRFHPSRQARHRAGLCPVRLPVSELDVLQDSRVVLAPRHVTRAGRVVVIVPGGQDHPARIRFTGD